MLFTVWNPQRGSQSYIERRRGRKGIEVCRRRKGGIKRREIDLGSTLFANCSPQSVTPTEIHSVGLRKEGEVGDRGDLGEKKESQKRERVIKPVITLLSKNGY